MKTELYLNVSCMAIFSDMMSQISRNILDYNRKPVVDLSVAAGAFAVRCIERDTSLAFKGAVPGNPPPAEQGLLEHYLMRVQQAQTVAAENGHVRPYALSLRHDDFTKLYFEAFGEPFEIERVPFRIGGTTVEFALDRAWWNFHYLTSLVIVVDFLQELSNTFGIVGAQSVLADARLKLSSRASQSIRDYASFVILLDDPETSKLARQRLYAESFGPGMAVSQYLSPSDRCGPNIHGSDDHFRVELKELASR